MQGLIILGAGFLLALLWLDLMFDVQVIPYLDLGVVEEGVLGSIADYYRRVTTDASPMNLGVAAMMFMIVIAGLFNVARGSGALWNRVATLILVLLPVIAARIKVLPDARLLGSGLGDLSERSALALDIFWLHSTAFVLVIGVIVLQLLPSATGSRKGQGAREGEAR